MNISPLKPGGTETVLAVQAQTTPWLRVMIPVVLAAASLFMASISWLKWPDLLIDFGEQVYLAWQISEGKVIYKDLTYLYGPFSGYLHALVFQLFGPGILTLAVFNMAVTAVLAVLIYKLILQTSDALTAAFCTLAFIVLFAFGQYTGGGNFNFICSYVYELPHGVALSLVTLYCFSQYTESRSAARLALVYFLLGLVFLTKPEVFLALVTALTAGTALSFYVQSLDTRSWTRNIAVCLSSALVAPILFWMYLSTHLSITTAFRAMISPWVYIQSASNLSLPLYQWVLGIDAVGSNLFHLVLYFLIGVALLTAVTLANRLLNKRGLGSQPILVSLGFLSAVLLYLIVKSFPLLEWLRPLPLIAVLLVIYYGLTIFRNKKNLPKNVLVLFTFSLFAFVLLFKILLNTHVYHYGFALAMPATLVTMRWILYEFPRLSSFFPGSTVYYRSTLTLLTLIIIAGHAGFSYQMHQFKGYPVGSGRDTLLDYYPELETRGPIVSETLRYIQEHTPPDSEITPIPFGNMINYMSRRHNPVRIHTLNPVEARIFGEGSYLEELKTADPDYILFLEVDSSRLGLRYFGHDYAQEIYQWIQNHYSLEKQFGAAPFTGQGFGIQILKRNE